MIEIAKLKELVALMKENDLAEVNLKNGDDLINIKRGGQAFLPPPATVLQTAPAFQAPPASLATPPVAAGSQPAIESPMVGTCYLAPTPDAAAFVKIGQSVTPDTVVCLIEAMKVFNEIKAEKSGIVEQVLVKNGQSVEFGQRIFTIRPN